MRNKYEKGTRSYNMSRIRSRDTKPEMEVRRYLYHNGCRYRVNVNTLPGKPDIVITTLKTAIFVNGCFWHGHENCRYFRLPKTRIEFWKNKIDRNVELGKLHSDALKALGYNVVVVWGCEVRSGEYKEKLQGFLKECLNGER